jgi:hypothetical protein
MGIGAPISRHCVVLGVGPDLDAARRNWPFGFLITVVSGEQEKWKDPKGDIHWGCWVGVVKVIAVFLLIWGIRGGACRKDSRRSWVEDGAEKGIVDGW